MDLTNKVALITGSSKGIGAATALAFADNNSKVVINCKESLDEARQIEEKIKAAGKEALVVQADVSKKDEVKKLFDTTIEYFGTVDILVNNASKQGGGDLIETDESLWQEHFQQDLLSTVMCSKAFVKLNKGKTEKKIVNISSLYGLFDECDPGYMQYGAAKAGVISFTKNLAKLVAPEILVNVIAPGYVLTSHWDTISDEIKKSCAQEPLIKRFIKPEEIADTVLFLAGNDAITGQIIVVDGGLTFV